MLHSGASCPGRADDGKRNDYAAVQIDFADFSCFLKICYVKTAHAEIAESKIITGGMRFSIAYPLLYYLYIFFYIFISLSLLAF